jgi:hypothetical protein
MEELLRNRRVVCRCPDRFAVAAAALLLLFVAIHNAWDAVTYHVFVKKRGQQEAERRPSE